MKRVIKDILTAASIAVIVYVLVKSYMLTIAFV